MMLKNINKYYSKYKKKLIKSILIISIIITIFLTIFIFRKVNLIIKEDIILNIKENYESINLMHGQSFHFNTSIEVRNYWLCTAKCEENIISISSGEILFNNTFYVKNNLIKKNSLEIQVEKGYGQSLYQYNIYCKNSYSKSCPINNKTYFRRKTVIINHEPNEYEKEIINKSIDLFYNISYNIEKSNLNINNTRNILSNLSIFFNDSFENNIYSQYEMLSNLKNKEYEFLEKWNKDDYEEAYSVLNNILNNSIELLNHSNKLLIMTQNKILNYNKIMEIHNINLKKALLIKEMISKYPDKDYEEFDGITIINLININTENLNSIQDNLKNYDEEKILKEIFFEEIKINETLTQFDLAIKKTRTDYLTLLIIDNVSCSAINCNQSYEKNITKILEEIKEQIQEKDIANRDFINDSNIRMLNEINNRCEIYKNIKQNLNNAKNITKNNRNNTNISEAKVIEEEKIFIFNLLNNLNLSNDLNHKKNYYLELINISNTTINSTNITLNYNLTKYFFLNFEFLEESINNIERYCNNSLNSHKDLEIKNFSFKKYFLPVFNDSLEINKINFPENKCCFYKKCKKCLEYNKYPIILLHGHSFNKKNSAYESTEIFDFIEKKFEKEYVSLGAGNFYNLNIRIYFNILIKPTYYVNKKDIFGTELIESKDETIEEYADRLKEIIETTKNISGKEKINIVAHSMGGLVTRRYIQKYGPENINNLILIATPNYGITEKIYVLCGIFGNKKECIDMKEGSEFIKKINTPYPMPKTFLIIGTGCYLDGEESDGIVTVNNAKMSNDINYTVYYIEGKCTTTKLLHNELLNNKKTIDLIKNIISE